MHARKVLVHRHVLARVGLLDEILLARAEEHPAEHRGAGGRIGVLTHLRVRLRELARRIEEHLRQERVDARRERVLAGHCFVDVQVRHKTIAQLGFELLHISVLAY